VLIFVINIGQAGSAHLVRTSHLARTSRSHSPHSICPNRALPHCLSYLHGVFGTGFSNKGVGARWDLLFLSVHVTLDELGLKECCRSYKRKTWAGAECVPDWVLQRVEDFILPNGACKLRTRAEVLGTIESQPCAISGTLHLYLPLFHQTLGPL
jgi:hypothetical protein